MLLSAFKSRTIWFSILLSVLSVLQGSLQIFHLTPRDQAIVGMVIAVAVAVLRAVTTMPLEKK